MDSPRTAAAMRPLPPTAALRGRDHTSLRTVAVESPASGLAIALTRGGREKRYAYVDPNEDVVAAVAGPRATLLVVADGHHGVEASEAAVESILTALGEDPPPADLDDDEIVGLFLDATIAVQRRTSVAAARNRASRTTLALALVTGARVQWASFGDSAVIVASPASARRLDVPRPRFVGFPLTREELALVFARGRHELGPQDWVVLATDGFTDFALPAHLTAEEIVSLALSDASDAPGLVRALVRRAVDGGAGDNVAVALAAPSSSPA